jgi:hypothetical protein
VWTALGLALSALFKELLSLWWKQANTPTNASDARPGPSGMYDRFADRVRQHTGRIRPPS